MCECLVLGVTFCVLVCCDEREENRTAASRARPITTPARANI